MEGLSPNTNQNKLELGLEIYQAKLNKEFSQSLWSVAENGLILSAKIIKQEIFNFLSRKNTNDTNITRTHLARHKPDQVKIQTLTSRITANIRASKLTAIHERIRAAPTREEKDRISEEQIPMIVKAIRYTLTHNESIPDEGRKLILTLLDVPNPA